MLLFSVTSNRDFILILVIRLGNWFQQFFFSIFEIQTKRNHYYFFLTSSD